MTKWFLKKTRPNSRARKVAHAIWVSELLVVHALRQLWKVVRYYVWPAVRIAGAHAWKFLKNTVWPLARALAVMIWKGVRTSLIVVAYLFMRYVYPHLSSAMHYIYVRWLVPVWDRSGGRVVAWFERLPKIPKFAGVFAVVTLMVVSGMHLFQTDAATATWTQTDWSGGVGTNTTTQFSSKSGIISSVAGQLTADIPISNIGFEDQLNGWQVGKLPTQVANLSSWYKADALSLADGATVSSWVDSSGNGRSFTAGNAVYKTNIINGLPVVRISGSQSVGGTSVKVLPASSTSHTIISYSKLTLAAPPQEVLLFDTTATLGIGALSGNIVQYYVGPYQNFTASLNVQGGSGYIGTFDRINTGVSYYRNGIQQEAQKTLGSNTPFNANTFGRSPANSANQDLAENIFYSSNISTADRQGVESYLAQKYQGPSTYVLATTETGTVYDGSRSVKLVSGTVGGYFGQSFTGSNTETRKFSAYVRTDGSAVTSSDIQIQDNYSAVSSTYTSVGGGWYRVEADVTVTTGAEYFGVYVPPNKTVYVDDAGFNTAELVSAAFDTGDAGVILGSLEWSATTPGTTSVTFQMRTSPDGSSWTSWLGPTGTGDYYTASNGSEAINPTHSDTVDDRYVQYRAYLVSDGTSPTLQDVSLMYVVNGAPEFNPNFPGLAGGGVTAIQNSVGLVTIQYSVRDEDTLGGSVQPGFVTPTFEYSIDDGDNWTTIPSGDLVAGDLDNKAVDPVTYTEYSATWDAPGTISAYTTQARIRVTADDGEGANNTANEDSSAFILDTADPTINGLTVSAIENPAEISFTCSDDTSIEQRYGLASDLSDGVWESYTGTVTVTLASDPDTVYAQCRDAYGNYTAIVSAVTPETPSAIFYQDISDASNDNYRFFIAWSVIDEPVDGFAAYRVYRSSNGGASYSLVHTITNRLVNYVIDDGLSEGQEYYYVIVAEDDLGSLSYESGPIQDVPDGSGGTDLSPPTLTNIGSSGVGATQAMISWDTSEFSDSVVYYKESIIDPGVNPNDYDETQGVPTVVTDHEVVLSGLSPNTQYYYLVQSTDASSNTQVSSTSGTFTTGSGPVITGVTTPSIFNTEATIAWDTDVSSDSTVFYSENSDLSGASQLGSSALVQDHSVRLTGLTSGTQYYFFVSSTDAGSNTTTDRNIVNGVTEYYTFTTTSDDSAPIIMDVEAALIGEHGVTISWETDEISTSQVEWGLTTDFGNITDETDTYTTQHAVTITGLEDTTEYFYKVRSLDNAGNASEDNNGGDMYSFTTLAPSVEIVRDREVVVRNERDRSAPKISNIKVEVSGTRAEITFTTDEVARASVGWGLTTALGQTAGDSETYRTQHSVVLRSLAPSTNYSYRITVSDSSGNDAQSDIRAFQTETESADDEAQDSALQRLIAAISGGASESQLVASLSDAASTLGLSIGGLGGDTGSETGPIQNIQVVGSTPTSVDLSWRTPVPTRSELFLTDLRTGETRPLSDNSFVSAHNITIPRLEQAASYSVRITAITETGETVSSQPFPFSTELDTSPLQISAVRITPSIISGSDERVQAVVSWRTNRPATSRIYFETGVQPGTVPSLSIEESSTFTREHLAVIPNLEPGQLYRVRVASRAGEGREVLSEDYTLLTPRSRENIVDLIVQNFEDSFSFLRR
jgi:hypothetical protein